MAPTRAKREFLEPPRGRRRKRRSHALLIVLLLSLVVHVTLLLVLPGNGRWAEDVYAAHIYPVVGPIVAFVPSLLPFSLAAVLLLGLSVWALAYLMWSLVDAHRTRMGFWRGLGRAVAAYLVVGTVMFHAFYLFWGYNYLRPPLEQRLGLAGADFSAERRAETAHFVVATTVAARVPVGPWDRHELDTLVDAAIDRAMRELEHRPTPVVSPLKGDLHTGLLALQGNQGVVSPWTLEAQVDFGLPPFRLAFAAAHEKAHLAGFARERDANFIAWYALAHSDDARLRYAAYMGVVSYFLTPETRPLAAALEPDFEALRQYQTQTVSPVVQHGSMQVYSVYMRANGMAAGLADYGSVWQLVLAWLELRTDELD